MNSIGLVDVLGELTFIWDMNEAKFFPNNLEFQILLLERRDLRKI
jgi:hypothetical protein